MFEEIRDILKEEKEIPFYLNVPFLIASQFLSWFVWVFVGVGILLSDKYFPYWFGFVLAILALYFIFILIALFKVLQHTTTSSQGEKNENNKALKRIMDAGFNGVIGSLAFYVVVFLILWLLKSMGVVDRFLVQVFEFTR